MVTRNILIIAAALFFFSLVSCGLGWHAGQGAPGTLPGDEQMWRGVALVLLVCALIAAVSGTMATLFSQVRRRDEEQKLRRRR